MVKTPNGEAFFGFPRLTDNELAVWRESLLDLIEDLRDLERVEVAEGVPKQDQVHKLDASSVVVSEVEPVEISDDEVSRLEAVKFDCIIFVLLENIQSNVLSLPNGHDTLLLIQQDLPIATTA